MPQRPLIGPLIVALLVPALLFAQADTTTPRISSPNAAGAIGVVIDSIHGGALVGASIRVEGTTLERISNNTGEFRFDSLPAGTRRFVLIHPLVDSIGFDIVSAPVVLSDGHVSVVALAVPSVATLRRLLCAARDTAEGKALIRGRVSDPDSDSSLAGARVTFEYSELTVSADSGLRRALRLRETRARKDGTFTICGLPVDVGGRLVAEYERVTTPDVPVRRDMDEIVFRSLTIAPAHTPAVAPASGSAPTRGGLLTGTAILRGRIMAPDSTAIADAQIAVARTERVTRSNPDGTFVLDRLPSGTSEVLVRKIGFAPASAIIELSAGAPAHSAVVLSRPAATLEAVSVTATLSARLQRVGFTDRRKMGIGRFVDTKDIERRQPIMVSDILRSLPGFRVVESASGRTIVPSRTMRGQNAYCVNFFVDHAIWEVRDPGDLDRAFTVNEIAAIEAYAGEYVPQEFAVPAKSCATIVLWTKQRLDER